MFFIRDPLKFPDFIRTQKRHPVTNLRTGTAAWDFWTPLPREPAPGHHPDERPRHPRQLPRFMDGFGSHTYSFWNADGERFWVKFHFKTRQGIAP